MQEAATKIISELVDRTLEYLRPIRELLDHRDDELLAKATLDDKQLKPLANHPINTKTSVRRDTADVADDALAGAAQ